LTFILTLGDSISSEKKKKKEKKKKLKTSEKTFDFGPFCQEKEKPKNFNDTFDSNQDFCPINSINH
jgi:hypothetical protein